MFATTIRVREFPDEAEEGFFGGLAALAEELKYNVPGFVQAYFMRSRDGGARLTALWESERIVDDVLTESEVGKYAREFFERYLSGATDEVEVLDVTWIAVHGEEYSERAKARRIEDPIKDERDKG